MPSTITINDIPTRNISDSKCLLTHCSTTCYFITNTQAATISAGNVFRHSIFLSQKLYEHYLASEVEAAGGGATGAGGAGGAGAVLTRERKSVSSSPLSLMLVK